MNPIVNSHNWLTGLLITDTLACGVLDGIQKLGTFFSFPDAIFEMDPASSAGSVKHKYLYTQSSQESTVKGIIIGVMRVINNIQKRQDCLSHLYEWTKFLTEW